jgi:CMP/dCMP kinase
MNNYKGTAGMIIAIDGPAGAGKTTTAREVAKQLGFSYLDTGAMYRALTWIAMQRHISPSDGATLTAMAQKFPIEFMPQDGLNKVLVGGVDVTSEIRTPEVTTAVSEVSAHKGVREAMVQKQRELGCKGSIVAEGRDTTTVVFPQAQVKVFLDATVRERAERRLKDLERMGLTSSVEEQESDIVRRDTYDSSRTHSPLTCPADAVVIDTSQLSIEQQVEKIVALVRSHATKA